MFIDLAKAFDSVDRCKLWKVLEDELQLSKPLGACIQDMYNDITLDLMDKGFVAAKVQYARGVKQGCPMSPLLFSLYIDRVSAWLKLHIER